MPKAASKKKAANGFKLPEPIPAGEILEDAVKKKWKLGPSICKGGFGEIYSAQESGSSGAKYPFVVKIEPHENGLLSVEMQLYENIAKADDVEDFKKQKGLKTFGMPLYLGSGSHEFNGQNYSFIVMEKFGNDLLKIFLENNRHFPTPTVFKIAIQILDVLEYIHSKGYVHANIKGANILLGTTKDTQNKQVYLVDFGLATKCNEDEDEFKPNPEKARDKAIEYLSRDAHNGVHTKRGDLESLAYNLIQWLGCTLPWENDINDSNAVQKLKEEFMSSVPKFIKACFDKRSPPGPIVDFLNCLSSLEDKAAPDYKTIRKIFLTGLTSSDTLGKPFQFTVPVKTPTKKSPVKRKNADAPAASSKRKQAKKDVKEASEDEKENFDDLSDSEEIVTKTNGTTTPKEKKKSNTGGRTKKNLTKDLVDDEVPEVQNESDKDVILDDGDDNEKMDDDAQATVESNETKVKQKRGRKKGSKGAAQKSKQQLVEDQTEEESVPEVMDPPMRTTRQRGRFVNYKEDSDDEQKPNRKKHKATNHAKFKATNPSKELHITGDSGDSGEERYTQAVKQVSKKKNEKSKKKAENKKTAVDKEDTDEESDSASIKADEISSGRKEEDTDED